MLSDTGMVMYSKSANVDELGASWTGWPPSLDRPALLLVPTVFRRMHALQRHTAPSLHLPLFVEETLLHTLVHNSNRYLRYSTTYIQHALVCIAHSHITAIFF